MLLDVVPADGVDGDGRGPCKAGGHDIRAKFGLIPLKTGTFEGSSKSSIPEYRKEGFHG